MKKAMFTLAAVVMASVLWAQTSGLSWSLGLDGAGSGTTSFARPLRMKDGDSFSIILSSEKDCYCYVIARDAQDATVVLYNNTLKAGILLTLGPVGLTPPPGTETFYVVASLKAETDIERKIAAFKKSGSPRKAADELVDSVIALRRSLSSAAEAPEKAVRIGGAFRGSRETPKGVNYSGAAAYVKTIRIQH